MKKHQFEEITAALSIIIALLSWHFEIYWLAGIYTGKAIFDTWAAIYYSYKSATKNKVK